MPGSGRKWVVAMTAASLLAMSGIAFAAPTESDDADTLFNVGYDSSFQILFWGTAPNDGSVDCELENGPVTVDFGEDDSVEATDFADCSMNGVQVTGPNGQINHGMFMKAFNSVFEGKGRGCLNRHLAKLDFGKGDQKVKVPDVDPAFEPAETGDSVDVDFLTFVTDCERKVKEKDSDDGESTTGSHGHGKPDSPGKSGQASGKSGEAPGKSGSAPGHNKSNSDS